MSYIDSEVAQGAAPFDSSLQGDPDRKSALVTFENDDPNGASPRQPVTTKTAQAVEGAIRNSDSVDSVNINSTTGGNRTGGNHPLGQAVDINKVNGESVLSQGASPAVTELQSNFGKNATARENYGPAQNTIYQRTYSNVPAATSNASPAIVRQHRNHIHFAAHKLPSKQLPTPRVKP